MRTSAPVIFPRNSWRGTPIQENRIKGLCLILDRELLRESPRQAMLTALSTGVRFFQYRSKTSSRKDIYETSLVLAETARNADALFVVNDHADIAAATGAHGVHLGQDDLPLREARKIVGSDRLIGISTHSKEQALAAEAGGADYIGFGPVFETSTKDAGRIQGPEKAAVVKQAVSIPVIAIGGIDARMLPRVLDAGVDGVAVISAVLSAPDPFLAAAEIMNIFSKRK